MGVQFMSAGTGIQHSEHNLAENEPLRFIQLWIVPRRRGLKPNYGSAIGDAKRRQDCFAHLVGDTDAAKDDRAAEHEGPAVRINQDVNIHVAEFSASGKGAQFSVAAGRQAYMICLEGGVSFQSDQATTTLRRHDAAEVFGPVDLWRQQVCSHRWRSQAKAPQGWSSSSRCKRMVAADLHNACMPRSSGRRLCDASLEALPTRVQSSFWRCDSTGCIPCDAAA